MTDREKAIAMAHTGICMLAGDKFQIFHQYVEDILGRPVQTIEMGMESIADEIKEKSREDFIALCREEQEPCEDCVSRRAVFEILNDAYFLKIDDGAALQESVRQLPPVTPQPKPNIKALGEDIRICQKSITDKNVLIGFNMAVALCNKYLAESEDSE